MPESNEAALEAAQYQDMLTQDAVQSYFERRIPIAVEPLDPSAVNVLAGQIERARAALSGGQVEGRPLTRVPRGTPVDRLPTDVFTELAALADFTSRLPEAFGSLRPSPLRAARSTEGTIEAAQAATRLAMPEVVAAITKATQQGGRS